MGNYFESNIYYNLGIYTQWMQDKLDEGAVKWYEKAVQFNPNCYRAHYKLGMYYIMNRNGEKAKTYFQSIINDLKEKSNYLQPLEYLYLFKAYQRLAYIAGYLDENRIQAREYEDRAEKLYRNCEEPNDFIDDFYGKEKNEFKEYLKQRINDLKVEQSF